MSEQMVYSEVRADGARLTVTSGVADRVAFRLVAGDRSVGLVVRFEADGSPVPMLTGDGCWPEGLAAELVDGYRRWGIDWLAVALTLAAREATP